MEWISLEYWISKVNGSNFRNGITPVLLGSMNEHWEEVGAFRVFEQVFAIISNAASSKIKFLGDEMIDKIIAILNNETMKPEERARELLGIE